ncbi:hypothetical protein N2152v2_008743 [Parachlorella kessleri]
MLARGWLAGTQVFSKEKRDERRKKLKEEMERGYFDDFKDFRDRKGKVFLASERLMPASQARLFPQIQVLQPDGTKACFPQPAISGGGSSSSSGGGSPGESASLVCIAFRAGAQEMLEAWAVPFSQRFQGKPGIRVIELSLVESVVMSVWPFKQAILRGGSKGQGKYQLPVEYLYHFGETEALRAALHMTNRLTGYVYLVDGQGRVRWQGSGSPGQEELQHLLRCGGELLTQQQVAGASSSSSSSSSGT